MWVFPLWKSKLQWNSKKRSETFLSGTENSRSPLSQLCRLTPGQKTPEVWPFLLKSQLRHLPPNWLSVEKQGRQKRWKTKILHGLFNIFSAVEKSLKYPSDILNSAIVQTLNPEAYGQPKVKCRRFQCIDSFPSEYRMPLQYSKSSNKKENRTYKIPVTEHESNTSPS